MKILSKLFLGVMLLNTTLGLSACVSKPETLPTPRLVYTCPRIVEYDRDTLLKVRDEYVSLVNKYPEFIGMISDYLALRDASRACQKDASLVLVQQPTKK